MKKWLKSMPAWALFALTFAACSGGASVEDFCAKEAECGLLGGSQTEQSCVTEGNQQFDLLKNDPNCAEVLDALQSLVDCAAPQSCAVLKQDGGLQKACADETAAFAKAFSAPSKCALGGSQQGSECTKAQDCPMVSCPNGGGGQGCLSGTCAKEADLCGK